MKETLNFLTPRTAISRLDEIIDGLGVNKIESSTLLGIWVYILALKAQRKVIGYLNDDNFYCQVLWDTATRFPSHPSLAADVLKYAEVFEADGELQAILNSFSGWSLFRQ